MDKLKLIEILEAEFQVKGTQKINSIIKSQSPGIRFYVEFLMAGRLVKWTIGICGINDDGIYLKKSKGKVFVPFEHVQVFSRHHFRSYVVLGARPIW